jgi:hypothetical protein
MAARLKIANRSGGAIRHAGRVARSIGPDAIAKGLGAEVVSRENVRGAPIALHVLRQELESRVRSTCGRPALEWATKIQKIPLKPEDWSRLEQLAGELSRQGVVSVTAGQVASVMLHSQLKRLAPLGARQARGAPDVNSR